MCLKGSGNGHTKKDPYINGHTCFKQCTPASGSGTIYGSSKPRIHQIGANREIVKKRKKERKAKLTKIMFLLLLSYTETWQIYHRHHQIHQLEGHTVHRSYRHTPPWWLWIHLDWLKQTKIKRFQLRHSWINLRDVKTCQMRT